MREAAIAHIQEAAVAAAGPPAREQTENMADRIGVMRDEPAEKVS